MFNINPKYKNIFFMAGEDNEAPPSSSPQKAKAKVKSSSLYEALYKYVKEKTNTIPTETNIVGLIDMLLTDNTEIVVDDKIKEART